MLNHDQTSQRLLDALEALELDPDDFHHVDHIRVAWHLLSTQPFDAAVQRFVNAVSRYAEHLGVPGKYHETVTLFYLHQVRDGVRQLPAGHDWDLFAAANPHLFEPHEALLERYYSKPLLDSAVAKRHFLLPDSLPISVRQASRS